MQRGNKSGGDDRFNAPTVKDEGSYPYHGQGNTTQLETPAESDMQDSMHPLRVIAHELRTPLAGMRAIVEYLLNPEISDDEKEPVFLQQVHDQILNMSMMLENLIELAQMDHGRSVAAESWSRFSLREVVEDAADAVRPLIEFAHVMLEIQVEPEELDMYGDRIGIERLIMNLLRNAQKHTTEGVIHVSICEHDSMIVIVVSDTGEGIPAAKSSRFGKPQVVSRGGDGQPNKTGSGLGLLICSEIINAHGGTMRIVSANGQGTQVAVELLASPEHSSVANQQ